MQKVTERAENHVRNINLSAKISSHHNMKVRRFEFIKRKKLKHMGRRTAEFVSISYARFLILEDFHLEACRK